MYVTCVHVFIYMGMFGVCPWTSQNILRAYVLRYDMSSGHDHSCCARAANTRDYALRRRRPPAG